MFSNIDFKALLQETYRQWKTDKASRLAAALSYYTIFSIAPLLIIVIAVAGMVFGQDAAEGKIVEQTEEMVGRDGAEVIQTMLENSNNMSSNVLATVIGIITLIIGATGVFGHLQESLNTIWGVEVIETGGVLGMVKKRFFSFTLVIGIGFLLLVSLVVSAGISALSKFAEDWVPGVDIGTQVINFVLSFGITTFLFGMMYRILPDVEIAWKDVWLGAAITSLLFTIGKFLIGLYLGQSSAASTYGAAGSLVVLLIWIYYSAQIVLLGAEFTQVYADKYGSTIVPNKNARVIRYITEAPS